MRQIKVFLKMNNKVLKWLEVANGLNYTWNINKISINDTILVTDFDCGSEFI